MVLQQLCFDLFLRTEGRQSGYAEAGALAMCGIWQHSGRRCLLETI